MSHRFLDSVGGVVQGTKRRYLCGGLSFLRWFKATRNSDQDYPPQGLSWLDPLACERSGHQNYGMTWSLI
jgi:hypothetical protein